MILPFKNVLFFIILLFQLNGQATTPVEKKIPRLSKMQDAYNTKTLTISWTPGHGGYFVQFESEAAFRNHVTDLDVQIAKQTIDFLKANPSFKISDFKNLKHLRILGYTTWQNQIGDYYPVDYITNLSEEDTQVFQNWLNSISELNALTELTIPSFLKVDINCKLVKLDYFIYKNDLNPNLLKHCDTVSKLTVYSNSHHDESIDFSSFKNLKSLTYNLYTLRTQNFSLPNLQACPDIFDIEFNCHDVDTLILHDRLFGKQLNINGNLQYFSCNEVTDVDSLAIIEMDCRSLTGLNILGLKSHSDFLQLNCFLPCIQEFDFNKLPINAKYASIVLKADSLSKITPPHQSAFALEYLSIESSVLKSVPLGFNRFTKLKTIEMMTPLLTHLPEDIFQLKSITGFFINKSNLNCIPTGIENLTSCEELVLFGLNKISKDDLRRLAVLEKLNYIWIGKCNIDTRNDSKLGRLKGLELKRNLPNTRITYFR